MNGDKGPKVSTPSVACGYVHSSPVATLSLVLPTMPQSYTPSMQTEQPLARAQGVVEAEVDGQRVLMSPKDFAYFGLVDTGAPVWDLIDGSRSIIEIVEILQVDYDGDPEQIRADVLDFVSGLGAAGLLQ